MKLSLYLLLAVVNAPAFQALNEQRQCKLSDYLSSPEFTELTDTIEQLCILQAGSFESTKRVYGGYHL